MTHFGTSNFGKTGNDFFEKQRSNVYHFFQKKWFWETTILDHFFFIFENVKITFSDFLKKRLIFYLNLNDLRAAISLKLL